MIKHFTSPLCQWHSEGIPVFLNKDSARESFFFIEFIKLSMFFRLDGISRKCKYWAGYPAIQLSFDKLEVSSPKIGPRPIFQEARPLFLLYSVYNKMLNSKVKKSKFWHHFVFWTFKTDKTKWAQNFDFLTFLLIKLISALYIVKQLESTLLIKKLEN